MDYGKRIKELREEIGMSGRALAMGSGFDPSQINKIEHNVNKPSLDGLERICSVLGVSLAKFFSTDQDLSTLPPDIFDLVSKKENHGLLKLIQDMTNKNYTTEVIEEWIISLDKTLESLKKKYGLISLKDQIIWVDEELLPESAQGKYSDEEKQAIISKLKEKRQDPNFRPPWES